MGHVHDRWTRPGPTGRKVRTDRWGQGKRWRARWTDPDGQERSKACATRDEALGQLAKVDTALREGTYVADSPVTFGEYADGWLSSQLQQRSQTNAQARGVLVRYAFPVIGHVPIGRVTRAQVQQVVNEATGLGPGARRVLYVWVRAVFASAVEDRLVVVTPCRRINLPSVPARRVAPLSVEQVGVIARGVPAHLEGAVWLGAGSGLRPGELRGLTVDRVRGDRVVVDRQLAPGSTARAPVWGPLKTVSSVRVVSLAPVTVVALERHLGRFGRGPGGLVFCSERGGALGRSSLQRAWGLGVAGLGLDGRSGWHELRHHHASLLIAGGASPRAVADRLGHGDPAETLRTYSHLWPSDEGRMVGAVQAAYGGPGEGAAAL